MKTLFYRYDVNLFVEIAVLLSCYSNLFDPADSILAAGCHI